MVTKEDEKIMESLSDRSRRERSERRRNRRRSGLIFGNIALALGIVVVVLVIRVIALGTPNADKEKAAHKIAEKATATPIATPTASPTATPNGADHWIRKDLDASKPMIAFTFDDGPYAKVTRRILKALNKSNGRATFFVVGNRVPEFSETLALQYEQGNQIGSHTFDHKDLSKMKAKKIKWEINKTNQKVSKVIGCNTTALRPPYGNVSDTMRKTIKTPMYYWSIDSEDWKSRNANSIVKRCKDAKDGDIILMHDLYPTTADAVERLAPYFVKKGFQLVTLDEMFYYKHKDAEPGNVYFPHDKSGYNK